MAICYYEMEEYQNAEKCWFKLFTNPSVKGKEGEITISLMYFLKYMYKTRGWPHNSQLESFYQEMTNGVSDEEIRKLGRVDYD
jgi:hypothetical protein